MLFACNYLRYPMLATELHLPAMLLSGGGPRFTRGDQMALIDPLGLAILAAISFGFGIPFGIPVGYGIRPRYRVSDSTNRMGKA
jgi:hypothetical protein